MCAYERVRTRTYVHTYIHSYGYRYRDYDIYTFNVCIYVYTYTHKHTHTHTHTHTLMICVCVCMCVRACVCVCVCVCVYLHRWFEVFEMIRKLLLSALIVFFRDYSSARAVPNFEIFSGFTISFLSLLIVLVSRPYVSSRLQTLMTFALITQTLTIAYGLMLKTYGEAQEGSRSGTSLFLETTIVALNITLVFVPILQSVSDAVYHALVGRIFNPTYSKEEINQGLDTDTAVSGDQSFAFTSGAPEIEDQQHRGPSGTSPSMAAYIVFSKDTGVTEEVTEISPRVRSKDIIFSKDAGGVTEEVTSYSSIAPATQQCLYAHHQLKEEAEQQPEKKEHKKRSQESPTDGEHLPSRSTIEGPTISQLWKSLADEANKI